MKTISWISVVTLGLFALSAGSATATFHGPATPAPAAEAPVVETTADVALFTVEQAERGRAGYEAHLEGTEEGATLVGEAFVESWEGSTVGAFYAWLSETVPTGAPGTLTLAEYADIAAFIFQQNGFAAGDTEFDPAAEGWADLVIVLPQP